MLWIRSGCLKLKTRGETTWKARVAGRLVSFSIFAQQGAVVSLSVVLLFLLSMEAAWEFDISFANEMLVE